MLYDFRCEVSGIDPVLISHCAIHAAKRRYGIDQHGFDWAPEMVLRSLKKKLRKGISAKEFADAVLEEEVVRVDFKDPDGYTFSKVYHHAEAEKEASVWKSFVPGRTARFSKPLPLKQLIKIIKRRR